MKASKRQSKSVAGVDISSPSKQASPERFSRIVVASFVFLSLPTIASLGARWHWFLDLASHFRVQYAIGMLPLFVIFAIRRRWKLAVAAAVVCGWNAALFVPDMLPIEKPPVSTSRKPIKAILANVFAGNTKHQAFLDFIEQEQPDFFLVLEADGSWLQSLEALKTDYPHVAVKPRTDSFGIAFFSRIPIKQHRVVALANSGVPSLVIEMDIGDQPITVIGTHPLPPVGSQNSSDRNQHLLALAKLAQGISTPLIVLGDLNVTPWSPHFSDLIEKTSLGDSRSGFGIQASWPTQRPPMMIPIDHALFSEDFCIEDRRIGPNINSDHLPVIVEFWVTACLNERP